MPLNELVLVLLPNETVAPLNEPEPETLLQPAVTATDWLSVVVLVVTPFHLTYLERVWLALQLKVALPPEAATGLGEAVTVRPEVTQAE